MRLIDADKLKQNLLDKSFFSAIVMRAMENAPTVNPYEWISVEDRLPSDGEPVLTIDSQGTIEVCFYEEKCKGVFQQCGGLVKIYNITHWMPLPAPPTEKDK